MYEPCYNLQEHVNAAPQLLTQPLGPATESLPLSRRPSHHRERTYNSGRQSQDSTPGSSTGSGGRQSPAPGLSAGTAAQSRPAAVTGEPVPASGPSVQLEEAQQGLPQLPQLMGSFGSNSGAPDAPAMHDLHATMQLLQQIDVETAIHCAGSPQMPAALQAGFVSQEPRLVHPAAADQAVESDSRLPDASAPVEAAVIAQHQHHGSRADLAQGGTVHQHEGEEAQGSSHDIQQADSSQQQADTIEKQRLLRYEVQGSIADDAEFRQEGEPQGESDTDDSHVLGAESWGMQEQASYELRSKPSAGQAA